MDLDQLVEARIINKLPIDPLGGTYYMDNSTGEILNTSSIKPLTFKGKTAKTGAMRRDFNDWRNSSN